MRRAGTGHPLGRAVTVCGVAGLLALASQAPAIAVVAPSDPDLPVQQTATTPTTPSTASPAAEPVTPAEADPAAAGGPTPAQQGIVGASAWTSLRLSAQDAINAHTSDLSAAQLMATLGRPGSLAINLRADPAQVAGADGALSAAWVKCPNDSWCGAGEVVTIAGLGGPEGPLQWSDYAGSVWDRTALAAAGQPAEVPANSNALHTVVDPLVPAGSPGATTWVAQLWPQLADVEHLPKPGQTLKVRYRSVDGQVHFVPLALPAYPVSVPVVNAATVGTITGDTLTTDAAGQLAISFWRPQQLQAAGTDESVRDLGGLYYGLVLSDGASWISCSPARYSAPLGMAPSAETVWDGPTGQNSLSLRDSAPFDLDLIQSSPIGFTLDVGGCLADSAAAGTQLGADLSATLIAADSPAAGAATDPLGGPATASAGVSYQLALPPASQ